MRGGGIALAGFFAAIVASVVVVLAISWFGGSVHSLEALCAGQAALWVCLFAACKIAVRRHGSGSLRDLGLVRLSGRQVGAGLVIGLVTRFGAGALAVALIQLFSKDGDWTVTSDEGTLDNNKRDVSLTGNVIIRSNDGLEMKTAACRWTPTSAPSCPTAGPRSRSCWAGWASTPA